MIRRWLEPRARTIHARKAAWGLVAAAAVIILAWTGQEKLQSLATRWELDPPTAVTGAHAAWTSLLMQASQPEDAVGAAGPTAMPGPVTNDRPMETPAVVAPAVPKTEAEQDLDRNDGSGEVEQEAGGREEASAVDDDDSHQLFAEELREDDDDDEAVVVRPRSTAAPAAAATTTASSSSMTVSECVANYGTRHFLRDDQPTAPPILYSFPGKRDSIPPNPEEPF